MSFFPRTIVFLAQSSYFGPERIETKMAVDSDVSFVLLEFRRLGKCQSKQYQNMRK